MKTMGQRLGVVLCIALALLSAFYAFVVRRVHSGTSFWMIWLVIAIILILLAICSDRLVVKCSPSRTECHYCSDLYPLSALWRSALWRGASSAEWTSTPILISTMWWCLERRCANQVRAKCCGIVLTPQSTI